MKAIYSKSGKLICFLDEKKLPDLVKKYEKKYHIINVKPCPHCKGTGYISGGEK